MGSISSDCSSGAGNSGTSTTSWWRSGWTAPVFWVSLVIGIILIVIIVLLCFLFCCPWFCICLPCCATRNGRLEEKSEQEGKDERKIRRQSDQRRSTHSPVVVVDNSQMYEQMSGYSSDDGGAHESNRQYHSQVRHNRDYEDLDHGTRNHMEGVQYDVPRHYIQHGENVRTAKKKSNLVTEELEDRMRKASGVAK